MHYLVVAVVFALVSTVLNLLLTFGVIRKLREHDSRFAAALEPPAGPAVGSTVAPLTATTVTGHRVSTVDTGRATLVGFFSPGCRPCADRIPEFLEMRARTGVAAIAVIVTSTDTDTGGPYEAALRPADVVVEPGGGPLADAFGVSSYPTLCLLDPAGVVLGSGNAFTDLPALVSA